MRWFRFYDDALNDPKVQRLSAPLFKAWVNLLCLASKFGGALPDMYDVAFALRVPEPQAEKIVRDLVEAKLLDATETGYAPHNWQGRQYASDSSAERVKRHRKRTRNADVTVTVTAPDEKSNAAEAEAEQIQNQKQSRADARAPDDAIRICTKLRALVSDQSQIIGWHWADIATFLAAGFSEAEIVGAVEKSLARGKVPGTFRYFEPALRDGRMPQAPPEPPKTEAMKRWELEENARNRPAN